MEIIRFIIEIIIGLGVIVGAIAYILNWCFKVSNRLSLIENKIDEMPNKITLSIVEEFKPFFIARIMKENNPLSQQELNERNILLLKLQNNTINPDEAKRLKILLETEKLDAEIKSNFELVFAILFALLAIGTIISISNKK